MIYITCGTCGTSKGYKTRADGAISLPAPEEARLVARGVASYVTKPIIDPDSGVATPGEGGDGGSRGDTPPERDPASTGQETGESEDGGEQEMLTGHLDAAELATWRKGDLEKLAADMGVDISKAKNNTERAAILAAVEVQAPTDGGEDDEAPPDLGAEAPMV